MHGGGGGCPAKSVKSQLFEDFFKNPSLRLNKIAAKDPHPCINFIDCTDCTDCIDFIACIDCSNCITVVYLGGSGGVVSVMTKGSKVDHTCYIFLERY